MLQRALINPTRLFAGPCLHNGGTAQVRVRPAASGGGISFIREDLPHRPVIPATLEHALPGPRRTSLGRGAAEISTVEHLLSALWALGIFDAEISLDGVEVPILDGSALPFARDLLRQSRPVEEDLVARPHWWVARGFSRRRGISSCTLIPSEGLTLDCRIDYPTLGEQWVRMVGLTCYMHRYAPARTFGFLEEARTLRGRGLARGANLSNVLVLSGGAVVNPGGRRFSEEPVRHKVVDALGDLSLLGGPLSGIIRLKCCGHALLLSTLSEAIRQGALRRGVKRCTRT